MKEFMKLNRKNKILKLNDEIVKMFKQAKYQEIVDRLEDFADSHKLPIEDTNNFKPQMYIKLLKCYLNLGSMSSLEKCGYFARKFLRQSITYLNDQTSASNKNNESNDEITNLINQIKNDHTQKILSFNLELLDIIHKYLIF